MWIAWGLASLLFLFLAENVWIEPWLRHKFHQIPTLVPAARSGVWFLALAIGGIVLTLLLVSQVQIIRDRSLSIWKKISTGMAVFFVLLLSVQWFFVTNGQPGLFRLHTAGKPHKVVLRWEASRSQVFGYNVYRSTTPGANYLKLNSSPVQGLTYTDDTVVTGVTYYYVTRSADKVGNESANSPQFTITIP